MHGLVQAVLTRREGAVQLATEGGQNSRMQCHRGSSLRAGHVKDQVLRHQRLALQLDGLKGDDSVSV